MTRGRVARKLIFLLVLVLMLSVAATFLFAHVYFQSPILPKDVKVVRILVEKDAHRLSIYDADGGLLKSYPVSLGRSPVGPKRCEGDCKTPEGIYSITAHNPNSAFYKSLRISYPNEADTARARKDGVAPGSDIMIHGMRNGLGFLGHAHLLADWTAGCIAVTDEEMDELWRAVHDGTPIEIRP